MLLTDSMTIKPLGNIQQLEIDNAFANAKLSLFGGHILSFKPKHDNSERLWLSNKAMFDGRKAIRGGIPICWPWFGDHASNSDLAAHGYVRNQTWGVIEAQDTPTGTLLKLQPQSSAGKGFEGKAQLTLVVFVGKTLKVQLHTHNLGDSPFTYTCALHSYFAITNIQSCELQGLSGQYIDKTRDYQTFETPSPYGFNQETDRVHLQTPSKVTIYQGQQNISILSAGHDSIVVWNPWQEKSVAMQDMSDTGYQSMLCVETAITQGQEVQAGETHVLEQIIQ